MLIVLILYLFVFIYAYKLKVLWSVSFIFNVIILTIITLLSFFEVLILTPNDFYIRLDEMAFREWAMSSSLDAFKDNTRYFIYILYSYLNYNLSGEWIFKLQNTPFALLIVLILFNVSGKKQVLWLFPIFYSYFFFLSTLHMRDTIIITAVLFFCQKLALSNTLKLLTFWWILSNVFFLFIRPEFAIIFLLIYLLLIIEKISKLKLKNLFILPGLLLLLLTATPLFEKIIFFIADYFYPGRLDLYLALRSEEVVGKLPYLNENSSAIIRQLVTPFPSSLFFRLVDMGGITNNLFFKELFRITLMLSFYLFSFFIFIRLSKVTKVLTEDRFSALLFFVSISITILYALYGDGGGATRNKVFPFLLVFYLFNVIYNVTVKSFNCNP